MDRQAYIQQLHEKRVVVANRILCLESRLPHLVVVDASHLGTPEGETNFVVDCPKHDYYQPERYASIIELRDEFERITAELCELGDQKVFVEP